jgi:hypothetical protein
MDYPNGTPRPDGQPISTGPAIDTLAPSGVDNGATTVDSTQGREMTPTFLAELAHAMQLTAERERERIGAAVSEDAALNIERARARAVTETQELRRLAEEDVERIAAWSKAEMDQIRREAARRTDERRARLDEYLRQHESIIDVEIGGVDVAVREYHASLDRFFGELSQTNDPAEIARMAGTLPAPPDLEAVRAVARSGAVAKYADSEREHAETGTSGDAGPEASSTAETPVEPVGVMDPTLVTAPSEPAPASDPAEGESVALESAEGATTTDATTPVDATTPAEGTAPAEGATADATTPTEGTAPAPDATTMSVNGETDQPSAAVRLLRSIAPWTAPAAPESTDSSKPAD